MNCFPGYGINFEFFEEKVKSSDPLKPIRKEMDDAIKVVNWFFNHIYEVICDSNQIEFNWIISYFGHILAYPDQQTQQLLMIYGIGGCGKTAMIEILDLILGKLSISLNGIDNLKDKFNEIYSSRLMVVVNEVFSESQSHRSQKDVMDFMKDLVAGNGKIKSRGMYKDAKMIKNYTNYIFMGNHPTFLQDRRNYIFMCNPKYIKNMEYFSTVISPEGYFMTHYSEKTKHLVGYLIGLQILFMCGHEDKLDYSKPLISDFKYKIQRYIKIPTKFEYVVNLNNKPVQSHEILDKIAEENDDIYHMVKMIGEKNFVMNPFHCSKQTENGGLYIDLYSVYVDYAERQLSNTIHKNKKNFLQAFASSHHFQSKKIAPSKKIDWYNDRGNLVKRSGLTAFKFEDIFGKDSEIEKFYSTFRKLVEIKSRGMESIRTLELYLIENEEAKKKKNIPEKASKLKYIPPEQLSEFVSCWMGLVNYFNEKKKDDFFLFQNEKFRFERMVTSSKKSKDRNNEVSDDSSGYSFEGSEDCLI